MFNNKKNDPLIDTVKTVMEQNRLFRQIEQELLEEYGVTSRKALPHEILPEFDAVLAEAKKCAMEELADKDYDKDGKIESPKDEVWGSRLRAAKKAGKMDEESEQLDETSPRKAKKYIQRAADDLADKTDPQYGYITDKDEDEISRAVENRRKGIRRALKKMEESEQLDEKALNPYAVGMAQAMKTKGDKPPLEKSTIKKAHKIAKRVAKKSGQKLEEEMDIDLIMEEIRNNLQEQLAYVYENYDEETFNDYVNSLTEEEIEILGLNEKFFGYGDKNAGTGADPTATNKIAIQSTAEKEKSDIKQKSVMGQSAQSTPAPKAAAPNFGGGTNSGKVGAPAKPGAPMAAGQKVAIARAQDAKDMEKARTSLKGDKFGAREAQIKSRTPDQAFAAAKKAGNVPASSGAASKPSTGAGPKPVAKPSGVAQRTVAKKPTVAKGPSSVSRPTSSINRPAPRKAAPAQKSTQQITSGALGGAFSEETKPQIKESLEQFIRNKFLKG